MQNAKSDVGFERILLIGDTGTGKTSQFLTLPGKKYASIFDPSATSTLRGHDVDFDLWLPQQEELDFYPRSVRKGGKQENDSPTKGKANPEPNLYLNWVDDVNAKYDAGFFQQYNWYMVDSATFLARALFERVAWLQEKVHREDERTDYRIAGDCFIDLMRYLTAIPCNLLCTVHVKYDKDSKSAKSFNRMTLPGESRLFIPRMFSHVFICHTVGERFQIQTRPTNDYPTVRTTFQGLEVFHDVTIMDWEYPEEYGIGNILKGERSEDHENHNK